MKGAVADVRHYAPARGPGIVPAACTAIVTLGGNLVENDQFTDPVSGRFCMCTRLSTDVGDVHLVRSTLEEGLAVTRRLEQYKLFWWEEVVPGIDNLAVINQAAKMPTAGGESGGSSRETYGELQTAPEKSRTSSRLSGECYARGVPVRPAS